MLKLQRKEEGGKKMSTRESNVDEEKNKELGASIHK
jgi:hypothetical protein